MKRISVLAGAVVAALLMLVASATAAQAACDYPQPVFGISVDHQVVRGGDTFVAHARANVRCDWRMRFGDQRASGTGKQLRHRFSTPVVAHRTERSVRVTCRYSSGGGARPCGTARASRLWHGTVPVTLLSRNDSANVPPSAPTGGSPGGSAGPSAGFGGLLPNTGGPEFWILVAGLVLLLGGGTAVVVARRHDSAR